MRELQRLQRTKMQPLRQVVIRFRARLKIVSAELLPEPK